jgi:phage gp29-like protein
MRLFASRRRATPPTEAELTQLYGPLRDVVPLRAAPPPAPPPAPLAVTRVADFTPIFWAGRRMTPDQVRAVIEGAAGGRLQEQWALFDMMEDSWPRLAKNLAEVRRAAARATYAVQPYAPRGEEPTATARDRAATVEAALRNWRPRVGTLELSFEAALAAALDALGKGLSVLEVGWQRAPEGLLPRCAHLLHPRQYGWNEAGTELGLLASAPLSRGTAATWRPFPPGQFLVGVWPGRAGAPGQTALLRCLAPYWCGITFGWEWLLSNAQIFGVPFRWATYDPSRPENLTTLSQMLANLGSAGWAAFPQGTTLDFKEAVSRAADNPQVLVQQLADTYADQLILGQDASGAAQGDGLGAGSGALHASVRADRLQDAAQWCADLLNYQLVPAILRLNYGDEAEPPTIVPEEASETNPKAKADRDQVLAQIAPLPRRWFYERHAIPVPEEGEETVGGGPVSPPPGGPSEPPAPGQPSDAGAPGTGANPDAAEYGDFTPSEGPGGGEATSGAPKRAKSNSPRFAVALAARAASAAAQPLPGDYRMPAETRRRLAEAQSADFAALRQAAAPLLAAIEAGELGVVGELEAFIAKLDALAPAMIGAGALADALEAALAEAAIAGAAGAYAKAEPSPLASRL